MFSNTRRFALIIALLLAGIGITWGQRWASATRLSEEPLLRPADAGQAAAQEGQLETEHIYFLDVEGWYRITPFETVVRSRYDFGGDTTEAIALAIPPTLGEWKQVGPDQYIADDPGVILYLKQPTVALERAYQDSQGQSLNLTIIGNKGDDSFLLFSHTPETCYPGRLWQVVESRQESALLDDHLMHAQYLLTQHAETGERLMVLFWYLWDDPQRKSEEGVLSLRVNLFVPPDQSEEAVLARAWDFVRELFPSTIPWERF
jgi:hypothetical protein